VLGDFDDQQFSHLGLDSKFFREGEKYCIRTEGPDGKPTTYEAKYTFGVHPLQQYLVEFPKGRMQALSLAWDTNKQKWFDLHPDERILPNDELHWAQPSQSWNYMCAECHSTDLRKNYDEATDTYHTTWNEIDVSCEACHGPGSLHVEIAKSKKLFWDRHYGYALAPLKGHPAQNQLDMCARCHARRRIVHGGYEPGREFLDYYEPEMLDSDVYYPDGQIREEAYEYSSFLQSRMYREGIRCTDCHDPHSAKIRLQDNNLCTRCHTVGKYDAPAHHHHPVGSKGALCVECHMPSKDYMVVDPRRDHSIRIPRPDMTAQIGTPNSCQPCHKDKSNQWAIDTLDQWYGTGWRATPHYGVAIHGGRTTDPKAEDALVALAKHRPDLTKAKQVGDIVRASAIALLGNYGTSASRDAIEKALKDPNALVRAAAVRQLEPYSPLDTQAVEIAGRLLMPMLDDPIRLVRTEAARILTQVPSQQFSAAQWSRFKQVLEVWREGLQEVIDDAGSHIALGLAAANQGDIAEARKQYRKAIELHPNPLQAVQARMQLARLENQQGNNAAAEKLYRELIAVEPKWHEGHYQLGLLLAESDNRLADAAEALAKAVELRPNHARMQYNYGLALQKLGKLSAAEEHLREAAKLEPASADYPLALTLLLAEQRKWPQAIEVARQLVQRHPQYAELLQRLEQQSKRPVQPGPQPQ
jgi:predicted CXXCH cytochrome family protein